jgi:hypothetical protein
MTRELSLSKPVEHSTASPHLQWQPLPNGYKDWTLRDFQSRGWVYQVGPPRWESNELEEFWNWRR